jgi:hypothetical protein
MEDIMREVSDFSKYTEAELRKLLIENAKPATSGMARVVREITKKYNACDRDMLLWFISRPPYSGKLWAPDSKRILTAEEAEREEKRMVREQERQQKQRIEEQRKRATLPKTHRVVETIYPMPARRKVTKQPKQKGIVEQFKELGCKPVLIADKVVGITRMGSYAKVDAVIEQAHKDNWEVIEYD